MYIQGEGAGEDIQVEQPLGTHPPATGDAAVVTYPDVSIPKQHS